MYPVTRRGFGALSLGTLVSVGSPVKGAEKMRSIRIGMASAHTPQKFYDTAGALGITDSALVYPTMGKIGDTPPYDGFRSETNVILALKFLKRKNCTGMNSIDRDLCPDVLNRILGGEFDQELEKLAQMIVRDKRHVTIRPMYEAGGKDYQWQAYYPGNNPDDLSRAFRRVVEKIKVIAGAFVTVEFCVNWISASGPLVTDFARLYPGDSHVDRVVIDGYNRCGTTADRTKVREFTDFFRPAYAAVESVIGAHIPIGVGETSTTDACGNNKIEWFKRMFQVILKEFPRIDEIIFFFENVPVGKASNDFAIQWGIAPEDVDAFRSAVDTFRREFAEIPL